MGVSAYTSREREDLRDSRRRVFRWREGEAHVAVFGLLLRAIRCRIKFKSLVVVDIFAIGVTLAERFDLQKRIPQRVLIVIIQISTKR